MDNNYIQRFFIYLGTLCQYEYIQIFIFLHTYLILLFISQQVVMDYQTSQQITGQSKQKQKSLSPSHDKYKIVQIPHLKISNGISFLSFNHLNSCNNPQQHSVSNINNHTSINHKIASPNSDSNSNSNNNSNSKQQSAQTISQLQQLFPYQINQIIVEIALAEYNIDQQAKSQQQQIKRHRQSKLMFCLLIIVSLVTGTENLYIFLGGLPYRDVIFNFPTLLLRIIVLPVITLNICQNWQIILRLTFMFDKIMLSALLSYIGNIGFSIIFIPYTPSAWLYQSYFVLHPLFWLLYIGNFRLMMVYCQWSKAQVIIYKLSLLIGSTCYFILNAYYIIGKLRQTRGLNPKLNQSIQNLLLIFINAGFQVYLEMIARMDSIDGCSSFKINYKLQCSSQYMKLLENGRQQQDQSYFQDSDTDSSSDSQQHKQQYINSKRLLVQIEEVSLNSSDESLRTSSKKHQIIDIIYNQTTAKYKSQEIDAHT